MAWCWDKVKGHYTFSLSQKEPSPVNIFSCSVLTPPFLFIHNPGYVVSGSFSLTYFLTASLYCVLLGCNFGKVILNLNCHTVSGKEPWLCTEQVGSEWAELPSVLMFHANRLPQNWHDAHQALQPKCQTVRWEGSVEQHVGSSKTLTSRVWSWAHLAVDLEVCWYVWKGCSIRRLVNFMKNIISIF